jgi:hypothetical protein
MRIVNLPAVVNREVYLGDGLYVLWDGYGVKLRAPREHGDHWVYLEPDILYAFEQFIRNVKEEVKKERGDAR